MKTTNFSDLPFLLYFQGVRIYQKYSLNGNFDKLKFSFSEGEFTLSGETNTIRRNLLAMGSNFSIDALNDSESAIILLDQVSSASRWRFSLPEDFTYERFLEEIGVVKFNDFDYILTPSKGFQLL